LAREVLEATSSSSRRDTCLPSQATQGWNDSGFFQINNPAYTAANGQPFRLVQSGIGASQQTPGGLIVSGPLRGRYFGPIDPDTGVASVGTLQYGQVSGPWMVGGDWQYTRSNHAGTNSLIPDEERRAFLAAPPLQSLRRSKSLRRLPTMNIKG